MKNFYENLTANQKRSLTNSMRFLMNEYMNSYEWNVQHFKTKEMMINDLYFYWLRNCANKQYLWCEHLNERVFSDSFAREMKKRIRMLFSKNYSLHNTTQKENIL